MYQVLLFYKYTKIIDPVVTSLWQKLLCQQLGLLGRVIIADEGINGTLCGSKEATDRYSEAMRGYKLFSDIDFKKSFSEFLCFDSLQVKVKEEIVVLRENKERVSYLRSADTLLPHDFHNMLRDKYQNRRDDIVIFDTRNQYESRIGRFTDAVCPAIGTSRDFRDYFQKNRDIFKDKTVLMYCTGGVRCERISVLCQQSTEAAAIYHLKNGIHSYVEQFPDGYFRGRNYVFDDRVSIKVNEDVLTHCDICQIKCDLYNNCKNAICNKHHISCDSCYKKLNGCCSVDCQNLIKDKKVKERPILKSRAYLES